ncbi:site-specific integrase [Sphingosinicellaceae bacterium]|nr:site-specific integrase [Sphingosinicellaceae bacterium]
MCNYLSKPGATYYFRRLVPVDLQAQLGRREWSYSLKTKDRPEAKRRAQAEAVRTNGLIDDARASLALSVAPPAPSLTPRQRQRRDWQGQHELEAMEFLDALTAGKEREYEAREVMRQTVIRELGGSTASLSEKQRAIRDIVRDADEAARIANQNLAAVQYELRQRREVEAPVVPPPPEAQPDRTVGTMLETVIERWSIERKVTAKTRDAAKASVRWLYEAIGRVAVEQITRRDMLDFKDKLLGKGTTIANTKMKLSRISGLLGYALDNDMIPVNYAKGITLPDPKAAARKRAVYDTEALATLFAGPVHALGERPPQGRGEASYWLPLLALYTGARLEELGQLRPGDVRKATYSDGNDEVQTAWVINIVEDEADGLHLKNSGSARIIPVHPTLVELGFIDLVNTATAAKQKRIFSDLTPDKYGSYTAKWSMWYTVYRKNLGLIDKRLVFHSFRHTFKDNARHSGMIEGVQRQIMGHSGEGVADDYGSGHGLYRLVEGMTLYRVPGFVLPPKPLR